MNIYLIYIIDKSDDYLSTTIDHNNQLISQINTNNKYNIFNHVIITNAQIISTEQYDKLANVIFVDSFAKWWNTISKSMLKDNGHLIFLSNVVTFSDCNSFEQIVKETTNNNAVIWRCKTQHSSFPNKFGKEIDRTTVNWGCFCFKSKYLRSIALSDDRVHYGLLLKLNKACSLKWIDEYLTCYYNRSLYETPVTSSSTNSSNDIQLNENDIQLNENDMKNMEDRITSLLKGMSETFDDHSAIPVDNDKKYKLIEDSEYNHEYLSDSSDNNQDDDEIINKYMSEGSVLHSDSDNDDITNDELKYDDELKEDDVEKVSDNDSDENDDKPDETQILKRLSITKKISDLSQLNKRKSLDFRKCSNDHDTESDADTEISVDDGSSSSSNEYEYEASEIDDDLNNDVIKQMCIDDGITSKLITHDEYTSHIIPTSQQSKQQNIHQTTIINKISELKDKNVYVMSESSMNAIAKLIVNCLNIKEQYSKILQQLEMKIEPTVDINYRQLINEPILMKDVKYVKDVKDIKDTKDTKDTKDGKDGKYERKRSDSITSTISNISTVSSTTGTGKRTQFTSKKDMRMIKKIGGKRGKKLLIDLQSKNATSSTNSIENNVRQYDNMNDGNEKYETNDVKPVGKTKMYDKAILNDMFDCVYVIKMIGKETDVVNFLEENQVENYKLLDPKVNEKITKEMAKQSKTRLIFGYMDVIKDAKKFNYRHILILSDNIAFHKNFMYEFYQNVIHVPTQWKLLYLGAKHSVGKYNSFNKFDWEFYLDTYTDLNNVVPYTKDDAEEHWRRTGIKEGRIGCREIYLPNGKVGGMFAVGLSHEIFDEVQEQIISVLHEGTFYDILVDIQKIHYSECFVMRPNIVVEMLEHRTREHLALQMKAFQWDINFYNIPSKSDHAFQKNRVK